MNVFAAKYSNEPMNLTPHDAGGQIYAGITYQDHVLRSINKAEEL